MDRVQILESALQDRRLEFESATSKLASCEVAIATAQSEFDATNGDFAIWQTARDKLQFCERQLDRARAALQQCEENLACATTALRTAQREQKIDALQSQHSSHVARLTRDSAEFVDAVVDLIAKAIRLDELDAADGETCRALAALGTRADRISPTHAAMRVYLEKHAAPQQILDAFEQRGAYLSRGQAYTSAMKDGLARTLIPIFALVGSNETTRLEQLAMLGQSEAQEQLREQQAKQARIDAEKRAAFEASRASVPRLETPDEILSTDSRPPQIPAVLQNILNNL